MEPSGPLQACNGTALPFTVQHYILSPVGPDVLLRPLPSEALIPAYFLEGDVSVIKALNPLAPE